MTDINILIISDSPESAMILEKTLKDVGYRVWISNDPKEALGVLSQNTFAVLLTEARSGKMNGVEVTKQAHRISPGTNVIVLTLYSFINSAIEAMEAGAYGYITKPFNTSEIRIKVGYAVERFGLLSADKEKDYYAELAVIDGLTGLHNRRYFNEVMLMEFARLKRFASSLSLLMIDIDNFKNYNDTNGHVAGDELLRKLSRLLKASMREMDIVCRYGGEEFVAVLPQTDKKGAAIVAERLRVQATLYLPNTLSLGIATFPEDSQEIGGLIEKADAALYEAKRSGKNKYCVAKK